MAKIGIPLDDRGSMNERKTPVCEKGNGPSSFRQIQEWGDETSAGRFSIGQTIDSSSRVRVIEVKSPFLAHSGTAESAPSRTMAYRDLVSQRNWSRIASTY